MEEEVNQSRQGNTRGVNNHEHRIIGGATVDSSVFLRWRGANCQLLNNKLYIHIYTVYKLQE